MELSVFCLAAVMILTSVIIKGIFCLMSCYKPASWETTSFLPKKEKKDSAPENIIPIEIPMEDIERTSTPVPNEEKLRSKPDHHSQV